MACFCDFHNGVVHSPGGDHSRVPIADMAAAIDRKLQEILAPLAVAKRQELRDTLSLKEKERSALAKEVAEMEETQLRLQIRLNAIALKLNERREEEEECKVAMDQMRKEIELAERTSDIDLVNQDAITASPKLSAAAAVQVPRLELKLAQDPAAAAKVVSLQLRTVLTAHAGTESKADAIASVSLLCAGAHASSRCNSARSRWSAP